jgi:hypothetical protein
MGGRPIAAGHTVISKPASPKLLNDLEDPVDGIGVYRGIRLLPPLQPG